MFEAFSASAVSARNVIRIFYTPKRPSVNAVTSVGEGESDPMPRTGVQALPSRCCVGDEEQCTLHGTPQC